MSLSTNSYFRDLRRQLAQVKADIKYYEGNVEDADVPTKSFSDKACQTDPVPGETGASL